MWWALDSSLLYPIYFSKQHLWEKKEKVIQPMNCWAHGHNGRKRMPSISKVNNITYGNRVYFIVCIWGYCLGSIAPIWERIAMLDCSSKQWLEGLRAVIETSAGAWWMTFSDLARKGTIRWVDKLFRFYDWSTNTFLFYYGNYLKGIEAQNLKYKWFKPTCSNHQLTTITDISSSIFSTNNLIFFFKDAMLKSIPEISPRLTYH